MKGKRGLAAVIVVVVALTGCGKSTPAPGDTGSGTDTLPGNVTVTPDNDGFPGDGKTAEWRSYVARLDFNVDEDDLDSTAVLTYTCKGGDECGTDGVARFLVIPEKRGFRTDWNDIISSSSRKGLVLAAYWNMEGHEIKSLSLPAYARLYQWIGPVSATARGIQVFSVTDSTDVRVVAEGGPADYKWCKMAGNRDKAAAKRDPGHSCPDSASAQNPKKAMMMMSQSRFMEDLWLSCSGGCCQSSLTSVL